MASRNRKEMNQRIFELLATSASSKGVDISDPSATRFMAKLSDDDSGLMAGADTRAVAISRQMSLVRLSWKGEIFCCAIGFPMPNTIPCGLESVELTPGLFLTSVLESGIAPLTSVTGSDIRDVLEQESAETADYAGHELDQIARLFPSISCYRATIELPFHDDPHRLAGSLVSRSFVDGPFEPSPETLERLLALFEGGSQFIPYQALLQGALSISWEQFFLQTYRCVEQLYSVPRLLALCKEWQANSSLCDLSRLLENSLNWRPREDESLQRLFARTDPITLKSICIAFSTDAILDRDKLVEIAARRIYQLRNAIVHFRTAQEVEITNSKDWDQIVSCMLEIVNRLYDDLGTAFFERSKAA